MRKSKHISVLFLLLLLATGCNFQSMYEKSCSIQKSEWNKNQVVRFDLPVADTINGHNIFIEIRNNNDYPYSNLFLFVTTYSPNGASIRDTLQTILADEKGKWLGRGLGGVVSHEVLFKQNVRFPVSGNYKIEVIQAMRDEVLRGIMDVGIKIERVK